MRSSGGKASGSSEAVTFGCSPSQRTIAWPLSTPSMMSQQTPGCLSCDNDSLADLSWERVSLNQKKVLEKHEWSHLHWKHVRDVFTFQRRSVTDSQYFTWKLPWTLVHLQMDTACVEMRSRQKSKERSPSVRGKVISHQAVRNQTKTAMHHISIEPPDLWSICLVWNFTQSTMI